MCGFHTRANSLSFHRHFSEDGRIRATRTRNMCNNIWHHHHHHRSPTCGEGGWLCVCVCLCCFPRSMVESFARWWTHFPEMSCDTAEKGNNKKKKPIPTPPRKGKRKHANEMMCANNESGRFSQNITRSGIAVALGRRVRVVVVSQGELVEGSTSGAHHRAVPLARAHQKWRQEHRHRAAEFRAQR